MPVMALAAPSHPLGASLAIWGCAGAGYGQVNNTSAEHFDRLFHMEYGNSHYIGDFMVLSMFQKQKLGILQHCERSVCQKKNNIYIYPFTVEENFAFTPNLALFL